eukprot:Skav209994  [mRNA]  locus=scaffold3061:33316:56392:+ [translate_table: standard]
MLFVLRRIPGHNNECGNPCSGQVRETIVRLDDPLCYPPACVKSDEDCIWAAWDEWSSCKHMDELLGTRRELRDLHGVSWRSWRSWNETEPCQPSHAIDCELSEWAETPMACHVKAEIYDQGLVVRQTRESSWSDCSATCGGQTHRSRSITHDGNCILPGQASRTGAVLKETVACGHRECSTSSCRMSMWEEWSKCTSDCGIGATWRTRKVSPRNGGRLCEAKDKYEAPFCSSPAANGGEACNANLEMVEPCATAVCDESVCVDCLWEAWSEWGACTKLEAQRSHAEQGNIARVPNHCGRPCDSKAAKELGQCHRSREIATPAKGVKSGGLKWLVLRNWMQILRSGGGKPCQDWLEEANECNTRPCEEDSKDCKLGAWSKWTTCQDGPMKFRYRPIEQQPTSDWTPWDACDKTCGGGQQMRHRQVTKNPMNGGEACPEVLIETQGCALEPCRRRDCIACGRAPVQLVSEWAGWSGCSWQLSDACSMVAPDVAACEGGLLDFSDTTCALDLSNVKGPDLRRVRHSGAAVQLSMGSTAVCQALVLKVH